MMIRFLIIGLLFLIAPASHAQFKTATVGIDGLTCSMCSNSVEKLMRQLDFVSDVKMDLNSTTAEVTFHPDKKVNIHQLAKKVFDAGFSVRMIKAEVDFGQTLEAKEGKSFTYSGDEYIVVKDSDKTISGTMTVTFIGATYVSKKEFTHWKSLVNKYKGTSKGKSQVYHIIL